MLTDLFYLSSSVSTAHHNCQAFVCQAKVGNTLPWIEFEFHDRLDCRSLKVHAGVDGNASIVSSEVESMVILMGHPIL
jgi:hypothetical protein